MALIAVVCAAGAAMPYGDGYRAGVFDWMPDRFWLEEDYNRLPFALAKISKPIGSVKFADQLGNVLIENLPVDGTADLFLPANNQVTITLRDTANNSLPSVHQIGWKIVDAVGTILRAGTGTNISFDNLPAGTLDLVLVLGTAAPRTVSSGDEGPAAGPARCGDPVHCRHGTISRRKAGGLRGQSLAGWALAWYNLVNG